MPPNEQESTPSAAFTAQQARPEGQKDPDSALKQSKRKYKPLEVVIHQEDPGEESSMGKYDGTGSGASQQGSNGSEKKAKDPPKKSNNSAKVDIKLSSKGVREPKSAASNNEGKHR